MLFFAIKTKLLKATRGKEMGELWCFPSEKGGMEEGTSTQTAHFVAGEIIAKETQSTEKQRPLKLIRYATQLFPKWSVLTYIYILHALLNK